MENENMKRWGALQDNKRPAIWIRLAGIIALLALVTFPLLSNVLAGANAKYSARVAVDASARVAKWEVKLESNNVPVDPLSIPVIPDDGDEDGHELIVFFRGLEPDTDPTEGKLVEKKPAMFTMKFANNSEVTARFTPYASAEVGEPDVSFYKTQTPNPDGTFTYSNEVAQKGTNAGVVLAPGETLTPVYVVIKDSSFARLKIGADCAQEN